jgi:pyridoxine kinase
MHTEYDGYVAYDLATQMAGVLQAWRKLDLRFGAIYSGFLHAEAQVDILKTIIADYACPVYLDPVMGDDGVLYDGFRHSFVHKMRELVPYATVLLPNMTEAMLLIGVKYCPPPHSQQLVSDIVGALHAQGAKTVVLTGVQNGQDIGAVLSSGGKIQYALSKKLPGSYSGAGDVFGSLLVAKMMCQGDLWQAVQYAVDRTAKMLKI